jgi:hypothetical protein
MQKTSARLLSLLSLLQARRDWPDRCRLVMGAWSWPGLAASIGRFDADVEVVGPGELKEAFAHLARRYAGAGGLTLT